MDEARSDLPWKKPRREVVLLVLVAVVALLPMNGSNTQDQSRLCLAQALIHGRLSNDACLASSIDKSVFHGHLYSDKAPGMAIVEAVPEWLIGATPNQGGIRTWAMRAAIPGVFFVLCAFMVGRVSEGIAAGYGAVSLVAFAIGTPIALFADIGFSEVPTAALGFAAFLLAWRGRPLAAGALAGAALLFDYDAALILAAVGLYVLVRRRSWGLRYAAGALPALAVLGVYDWLAFGSPWHLSYRYIPGDLGAEQAKNFFGIGFPHLFTTYDVLVGSGGLLAVCPIALAAAAGLAVLAREYRAEAIVAGAIVAAFVFLDCGYFAPYGGTAVPRFVTPALPFLVLGLAPAFRANPRVSGLLAAVSVVAITALTPVWLTENAFPGTIWEALARVPTQLGASSFVRSVNPSVLGQLGVGRLWGAAIEACAALGALVLAVTTIPSTRPGDERKSDRASGRAWGLATVLGGLVLVSAATASAVAGYPYGHLTDGVKAPTVDLRESISASVPFAVPGDEVDFTIAVDNKEARTLDAVDLTIALSPAMQIHRLSTAAGGLECVGSSRVTCSLGSIMAHATTTVDLRVGITATPSGGHAKIAVSASANGVVSGGGASVTILTGE